MKLILAILTELDANGVQQRLLEHQFRVTHIASTGGFLRRGSTTLLIGLEAERVEDALAVLRSACEAPAASGQSRVTVFVLDVARFEQF